MLRRLNKALPSLVLGILIYGVLLQAAGFLLTDDLLHYSIGLWAGIGCALFMAVHMAMSIEDAVSIGTEDGAKKKTIASAMTRYFVVLIVLFAVFYFQLGMIPPTLLGVFGLKISAYLQPVFSKLAGKNDHYEGASIVDEEIM